MAQLTLRRVALLVACILVLCCSCTAYQLPHFPATATVSFNNQPTTPGQRLSTTTTTTTTPPTLTLPTARPASLHTVALIDPDAPSAASPVAANWLHYLQRNVPGTQLTHGLNLLTATTATTTTATATYAPPTPPPRTGPHRYVALVYEQSGELEGQGEVRIGKAEDGRRARWKVEEWVARAEAEGVNVTLVGGSWFVVEHGVDGEEIGELSMKQDM